VECKLEEELVARIDWVAELLKTSRTDIVRSACIAYLKNIEIGAKKVSELEFASHKRGRKSSVLVLRKSYS
jgi:metal-responsive CopG/Arc/MetJ family transcriptional regulator